MVSAPVIPSLHKLIPTVSGSIQTIHPDRILKLTQYLSSFFFVKSLNTVVFPNVQLQTFEVYFLFPLARVPDVASLCVSGVLCVHEMTKTLEAPVFRSVFHLPRVRVAVSETLTGGDQARTGPQDVCPRQSVFCQDDGIPEAGISTATSFIQPKSLRIQGYDSGTGSMLV